MRNNKIAVFTHFYVCNFGANLQALSTSSYLKKQGFDPVFINWTGYQKKLFTNVSGAQQQAHYGFIRSHLSVSPDLENDEQIYDYLVNNEIFNVLLGSDAVFGLDTWLSRFHVDRKGFHLSNSSADKQFPNPYWFTYLLRDKRFKIAAMSVSSQNCYYQLLPSSWRKGLRKCLMRFDYISVRDSWTAKMVKSLSGRKVCVTPDPVWGLNENYPQQVDKDTFLAKHEINQPYILLGFQPAYVEKSNRWIEEFINIAHKAGFICLPLPFAFGYLTNSKYDIQTKMPLDPLDWYNLIRFSSGYVGYNMHPVIASMHNCVPCFAVDNYGISLMKFFNLESSSKICDIMNKVGLGGYRKTIRRFFTSHDSSPLTVFNKLQNFDKSKMASSAEQQYEEYKTMMKSITKIFGNED